MILGRGILYVISDTMQELHDTIQELHDTMKKP